MLVCSLDAIHHDVAGIAAVVEHHQNLGGHCKVGNHQEDPYAVLVAGGLKFAANHDDHQMLALIADVAVGHC